MVLVLHGVEILCKEVIPHLQLQTWQSSTHLYLIMSIAGHDKSWRLSRSLHDFWRSGCLISFKEWGQRQEKGLSLGEVYNCVVASSGRTVCWTIIFCGSGGLTSVKLKAGVLFSFGVRGGAEFAALEPCKVEKRREQMLRCGWSNFSMCIVKCQKGKSPFRSTSYFGSSQYIDHQFDACPFWSGLQIFSLPSCQLRINKISLYKNKQKLLQATYHLIWTFHSRDPLCICKKIHKIIYYPRIEILAFLK